MLKQLPAIILLVLHVATDATPTLRAEQGILDLRSEQGQLFNIPLTGEWEFYWQQFVDPGQFDAVKPDVYGKVPAYWTSYAEAVPGITGTGYATYRLRILLPPGFHDSLMLDIPIFDTSYELFIDGEKVAGNGQVGTSEQAARPAYSPRTHNFEYAGDTMELVVHVANFSHRRGGFWMIMNLGEATPMLKKIERKKVINYGLLSILFVAFVMLFVLFLFENKRLSFLYFSLAALGLFFRLANTGFYSANFFIDKSWVWTVRFEYLGTYTAFIFGVLYLDRFFRSKVMHNIVVGNAIVYLAFSLTAIIIQPPLVSYSVYFLIFGVIFFLSYYLKRSFTGMINRDYQSTVFFFSMLMMLLAAVNDTLVSQSLGSLGNEYLLPITFLAFVMVQISLLFNHWIKTYQEKIRIHEELEYVNKNLEKIIAERTNELNQTNEELKQTLEMKDKMFSIIAHDLKSPMASLVQYAGLMLEKLRNTENAQLITELQRISVASLDLIDNLLHWGRQQQMSIRYQPEWVDLNKVIGETGLLMKYNLEDKNISLHVSVSTDVTAWCDSTLVHICLRNLLSNAIKFTPENGDISVSANAENDTVTVTVQDSGIGIDKEKLDRIRSENVESTPGTSGERGTGLGLIVVQEMIRINKGTFDIESKPGRGTSAKFTLPEKP
ncbi:MAG: sensor histidine kinase [Bacteroidales bacterium]|nr:sensor histidine kinase [Bacteroidales bacterium]MDT8431793.1 sensor histidine kinase [Bacteroidales bacterium]